MKHLPVHPTMRHPHTGKRLQALFVDKHGRARYPIMGAAEGDDPPDGPPKPPADTPKPPADPPSGEPKPGDLNYFPADTPRASMSPAEQLAFDAYNSQRWEKRAKGWGKHFPGKTPDEIKAIVDEVEKNRRNTLTLDEKTLEDAKAEARREALAEIGPKAVESAFNLLLGGMSEAERADALSVLDLTKFLNSDNQVDTEKVKAQVARIAPPVKGQTPPRDYGQGPRGTSAPTGGVAAIMQARREAREAKAPKS